MTTPSNPVRVIEGEIQIVGEDGHKVAVTDSNELKTTQTERENDVFAAYNASLNSDSYHIIISKDNPLWPHKIQGQSGNRIDITSLYFALDLAASSSGQIQIGVITRIDDTDASISYFYGIPFLSGVSKEVIIQNIRGVPSQVKLDFDNNGVLSHGITNTIDANNDSVNTGILLQSPAGAITPSAGDIILKYSHTSGTAILGLFIFYHNTD